MTYLSLLMNCTVDAFAAATLLAEPSRDAITLPPLKIVSVNTLVPPLVSLPV